MFENELRVKIDEQERKEQKLAHLLQTIQEGVSKYQSMQNRGTTTLSLNLKSYVQLIV